MGKKPLLNLNVVSFPPEGAGGNPPEEDSFECSVVQPSEEMGGAGKSIIEGKSYNGVKLGRLFIGRTGGFSQLKEWEIDVRVNMTCV